MEEQTPAQPQPKSSSAPADTKYLLIVCGLMMAIVILLSVLWIRERRITNDLRRTVQGLELQFQRMAIGGQLGKLFAPQGESSQAKPIQRLDLPAETVTWNGTSQTVLLVGAAAGQRIGLEPGDVVRICLPPATAPATKPASVSPSPPSVEPTTQPDV